MKNLKYKLSNFFFSPTSRAIKSLGILRIVISFLLLIEAVILIPSLETFYTSSGILHPTLNDIFSSKPILPKLSWFVEPLMRLGFTEMSGLHLVYSLHLVSLIFLLIGWKTKVAAVFAWFFHIQIYTSGYYSAYGVDHYTHFILFYLILVPCSEYLSIDSLQKEKVPLSTKKFASFCLRIVQFHFLTTYVGAGVEKALGADWIQGEAVWRSLMLPGFGQWDVSWLPFVPWVSMAMSWGTLVLEIFYPIALSFQRIRKFWIVSICLMHVGIALGLGMILFSSVMIALNLVLFLEPRPLRLSFFRNFFIGRGDRSRDSAPAYTS